MDAVRKLILDSVPNLAAMSRKIGMSHAYLQQFVTRGSPRELPERVREKLALELDIPPDRLRVTAPPARYETGGNHNVAVKESLIDGAVPSSSVVRSQPDIAGSLLIGKQDLPVYGIVQGGRGALILSNEPVDQVVRPDPLLRVKDGYGVIVVEDSMSPEFESGDIALVNPHLPPRGGDTCIFRHRDEDGTETACIKRLRRITESAWQVTEWNSDDGSRRDFALKRTEWQFCHVTVGNYKRR